MECKKALQEADGDLKKAGEILREKGAAKAVKRAERKIKEGRIAASVSDDKRCGALVEINIETDFAARNEKFGELVETVCQTALQTASTDLQALLAAKPSNGAAETIAALVTETISIIGENMGVRRCASFKVPDTDAGLIHAYIHPPGKVGVLLQIKCENDTVAKSDIADELAHDLCLQIAFSDPVSVDSSSVPESVIEAEKQIYRQQALNEGKPEQIIDKIVEGRIKGFFKDSCLIDQAYVKEEKISVGDLIKEKGKAAGGAISIVRFERYQLGGGGEEAAE
ncbi:translation elongation factor Ts, partial [bacterium]|nr:translation elongation factor Ts [bacterium]